jgi:hypothetical protein
MSNMKSFKEFLTESKKTYEFKIGVAGVLPEGFVDQLETAMQKFQVVNMGAGKKTPIQERPLDFPQLQNMEVTYYEVEVNYPTTSQVLQEYVGKCCGVDQSHIIVRNTNDPREEYQEPKSNEPYEARLTTEDMGGESAQEAVGGNRVMELLRELEADRKDRDNDPMEAAPKGESKDIENKENTKAVVGG